MNDLIVTVKLWDKEVGSLYWDNETNSALFDYERSFIRTGLDISPIIMSLKNYRGVPYQFLENLDRTRIVPLHGRLLGFKSSMNGLPVKDYPMKK